MRARLAFVVLALCPAPVHALQFTGTLDLGTGPAKWDQVESEGSRAQGRLGASFRSGSLFGLVPELAGGFGLSTEQAVLTALRWEVAGRLHTPGAVTGAWLGAGLSGVGTGTRTSALTRLEGGFRSGVGPAGFRVWLARTSFGIQPGGTGRTEASDGLTDSTAAGSKRVVEYTDLGTRAGLDLGRYELGATLVRRWGGSVLQSTARRNVAWEVNAVWWLQPSVGLVASVGHSLPELSIALPGARYRSLGVRLALGGPRRVSKAPAAAPPVKPAAAAGLVLAAPGRLAFVGPSARRAEVMGDFTDWRPVELARTGQGRWALDAPVNRGVHQLNVRFDGGPWLVPAGTLPVDDDFGGKTGLFVVR